MPRPVIRRALGRVANRRYLLVAGNGAPSCYVDDIDQVVDELAAAGVELVRYDAYDHDARGITPRAGGGRIAWFQDPDGNTFAIEADT
ncbi:hypothetical protein GCM10009817_17000 [Terrabacter lapilli]|uniref:Glyoxalase/fosfomycin resistance/dioxygenase domain-containing protein n=1 Tax=Terrabacter lapilli TaxID=436231 RepID=A0ABP5DE48_9MICO